MVIAVIQKGQPIVPSAAPILNGGIPSIWEAASSYGPMGPL